ncbi:hypothetical protein G6F22_014537 [Rhizopus arrhizus]|nr:hypothetical protein G6F22_014537 [Rhizopus arrhizus]
MHENEHGDFDTRLDPECSGPAGRCLPVARHRRGQLRICADRRAGAGPGEHAGQTGACAADAAHHDRHPRALSHRHQRLVVLVRRLRAEGLPGQRVLVGRGRCDSVQHHLWSAYQTDPLMSDSTSPAFSLEFFPPRDLAGQERLVRAAKQMLAIQPKYVSVTFGAGGSTRAGTADAVRTLRNLGCDAAPHLSCVGATRQDLRDILQAYKHEGVRRVVALRGDLPSGMGGDAGELRYANELVSFIREETGDWRPIRRPTWTISWPR